MTFYIPEKKAFCGAEIVSRTFHNLYTLRGTKVRDAKKWSHYIGEAIELFSDSQVYFGTHHWPLWGNEEVMEFLAKQRDIYKYTHDQTVRLFNAGYTPLEIAEKIKLPDSLAKFFPNRGYYGTVRHNSRAVYQSYLGWYDGRGVKADPDSKLFRFHGRSSQGKIIFTDLNESYTLSLKNSVLHHNKSKATGSKLDIIRFFGLNIVWFWMVFRHCSRVFQRSEKFYDSFIDSIRVFLLHPVANFWK